MSATNEDCNWYILETEKEEDDQAGPAADGHSTNPSSDTVAGGVTTGSLCPTIVINGTSSRVSVVTWEINNDRGHATNVGGLRKASTMMTTGLAGIQSPDGLRSVSGLNQRIIVSAVHDSRQTSELTESTNARKPIKRNGQVSAMSIRSTFNIEWQMGAISVLYADARCDL